VHKLATFWIKMENMDVLSDSGSLCNLLSVEDEECHDDSDNDVDLDEAFIPALGKKSAEILIEIDHHRKKVITLDDDNRNLEEVFTKAIAEDTALKEYVDSTVIFQIFNQKFNTWVDLDRSKELADGTHLKAIFQSKTKPDRGIGQSHESRKSGKRRHSDSSDVSSCKNHSSKILCSSSDGKGNKTEKVSHSVKTRSTDDERNAFISVPVCYHVSDSTQFDGQDVQKCKMNTAATGSGWKEQVSGSDSSPTVSEGLLFYQ
jgi:hypothetical protein